MLFCYVRLKGHVRKRLRADYPRVLNSLGDHLQKRRLDLGLLWKDVACQIGTGATNVALWSRNHTAPGLRFWPRIIQFLGYDPRPEAATPGQALRRWRRGSGLSQRQLAERLGVDPKTLRWWEQGVRIPPGKHLEKVKAILRTPGHS